jgi:monoamine oxidase
MRSLFARLRRRFGQRPTGAELRRRADLHFERLSTAMPTRPLLEPRLWRQSVSAPGKVAVIGAGFAGLCAAFEAFQCGFDVTVFETTGEGYGGRVMGTSFVPHRILEMGAELIGANHPLWMCYAQSFGLGLSVVTTEDRYDSARLHAPLRLEGKPLDYKTQQDLYGRMAVLFEDWSRTALSKLPGCDPWKPWGIKEAATLDGKSLGSQIPREQNDGGLADALDTQFYLDNCVDPARQSWLANLAQFSAGSTFGSDPLGFFDDTEVFRCENSNQALAARFKEVLLRSMRWGITIKSIAVDKTKVSLTDAGGTRQGSFDYAILAVPVSKYRDMQVKANGKDETPPSLTHGPAVKYLARLKERFWIPKGQAPSGMSDELGMTWEGTDNQMIDLENAAPQYDMSVFIGGKLAQTAIDKGGTNDYFATKLRQLYPDFPQVEGMFVSWPQTANIGMGYSCPAVNEVTTVQMKYSNAIGDRLFLAGEHTSPAWFGYMEGALQSGHIAVVRMCKAAGIDVGTWGCTAAL